MPFSLGSRQTSTSWCKTNTSCVWRRGHRAREGSCGTWWLKFMDDKMEKIPSACVRECYRCCLQAWPDISAGDPPSDRGISPVQVQRDKGRGTVWTLHSGTPPCPGGIPPLPARPAARPRSAKGTPEDSAGAEDPHSHLTGRGAVEELPAGAGRWRRRGPGARLCPRRREGWEGAGLPLRTPAAHCSRRQNSLGRILPGSCGTLRETVPCGQWGQPGVGPLHPRCWQRQGLSPPGVPHASCVLVLPCSWAPIDPSMAHVTEESLRELGACSGFM